MSEFAELHDELRSVARDLLGSGVDAEKAWRQSADAGWLGLEVDEGLDGAGVTFAETAVVLEEMGRAASPGPFLGTAVLGVGLLADVEPGEGRDDLLSAVATGERRVTAALNPHADEVVAAPPFRHASGRLVGQAQVLDAPSADVLLLLSDTDDGCAVVAVGPDQVSVEARPVLDDSRTFATVTAENVDVPAEAVWPLAGDPHRIAQRVLDRAAVAVAVDATGLAAAMLDATVEYAKDREQFDRPIGSFQAVKHQCADALVQLRVGRQLLDDAIEAVVADADDLPLVASRAKSFLTEAGVDVVGTAMQLHGGIGYTWESGIHRYLKRATLDRALFGSPATHRRRIAATLT